MSAQRPRSDIEMYEAMQHLPGVNPAMLNAAGMGTMGMPGMGLPGLTMDSNQPSESLWELIDDRMRGRWVWAILTGLGLAALLGFIGYHSTEPLYVSQGVVSVSPSVKSILYEIPGEHEEKHYDRFVATQAAYLKKTGVLERALEHPALAKLPFAQGKGGVGRLKAGLNVERDRESELIFVQFESEDAVVAQAAVNAILESYYDLHGKDKGSQIAALMNELHMVEEKFSRELDVYEKDREKLVAQYGTTDFRVMDEINVKRIAELEIAIQIAKRTLERNELKAAQEVGAAQDSGPLPQQLETIYPSLASARDQLDAAEQAFEMITSKFRQGTMQYNQAQQELNSRKRFYDNELRKRQNEWEMLGPNSPLKVAASDAVTPKVIVDMESELAATKSRQQDLLRDAKKLADLNTKIEDMKKAVSDAAGKYRALDIEKTTLGNFIEIAQGGALEEEPQKDARKTRAIMGVALALMASFGSFFLLGTIDRRAYGASQLQAGSNSRIPNCLGVLPDLGASLADPETSDVASHCVHQIRNQIEAVREPTEGYVLAITSPFQGDGKTSIVMALGWSYAAAGYSTLVIDCDLVGRSLTRQLGLMGRDGLKEALAARELNGSVSRMPVENLSAVPVGVNTNFGPENVRRIDLAKILDQVRSQYDIILIDTGPMLGSLESTPVTAAADGVVLSVRRGRSRSRLEECVTKLQMVGTRCVGIILNCAVRADCNRYVSEASLAAAEEDRAGRDSSTAIVKPIPGERNALVRAMQNSVRTREGQLGAGPSKVNGML